MPRNARAASSDHFIWSIRNLLAHPISEIAWIFGFRKASDWLHDKSIPKYLEEEAKSPVHIGYRCGKQTI